MVRWVPLSSNNVTGFIENNLRQFLLSLLANQSHCQQLVWFPQEDLWSDLELPEKLWTTSEAANSQSNYCLRLHWTPDYTGDRGLLSQDLLLLSTWPFKKIAWGKSRLSWEDVSGWEWELQHTWNVVPRNRSGFRQNDMQLISIFFSEWKRLNGVRFLRAKRMCFG